MDGPPLVCPAIKQLLRHSETVAEHEAFELHDGLHAVQKVVRSQELLQPRVIEGHGTSRGAVATEIESNLHQAP